AASSRFSPAARTALYTLSLHDALPICDHRPRAPRVPPHRIAQPLHLLLRDDSPSGTTHRPGPVTGRDGSPSATGHGCGAADAPRSEEHTSELQSRENLVCRLLPEKKNA